MRAAVSEETATYSPHTLSLMSSTGGRADVGNPTLSQYVTY